MFFFQLIRWPNLVVIALTQFTVLWTLTRKLTSIDWWNYSLLFMLPALLLCAAGNIINDLFDLRIDRINKAKKVWIDRKISKKLSLIIYVAFNMLAIIISLIFWRFDLFLLYFFIIGGLYLYSAAFKKIALAGNLIVAGFSAAIVGVLYYEAFPHFNATHIFYHLLFIAYIFFAFFSSLIRELIKDLQDVRGDAAFGLKTAPILWGIKKTKRLVIGLQFLLLTGLCLFLYLILQRESQAVALLKSYTILILIIPIFFFIIQTLNASSKAHFSHISKMLKLYMLLGLLLLWMI